MIDKDAITIRQVGVNSFRVTWSSTLDDQVFTVYRNDTRILQTKANTAVFTGAQLEGGIIQVLDSEEPYYPAKALRIALAWPALEDTDRYRVRQKKTGDEYALYTVVEDAGKDQHRLETFALDDEQTYEFEVVAIGKDENEGDAAEISHKMTRHPDAPPFELSFSDATKKITVSLAA